ncbi:diguanylate cyclase [Vibrio tapetis subsp. quintayensis]|uniref:diguanylate cyclase n=1 Tax=Vibrio tapetis TaxID=52443 RepID=UPI0025B34AF0|nr:transporter substrate-binding domain-containing protein [Vibrio tapetis]MDN3681918.1 diguanylate cyclase [Vibrio tapetis subsp. quintayensis]
MKANPVWRVHVDNDWPPYSYKEFGQTKGYTIELLLLVAQKAGARIEFVEGGSWRNSGQLLSQGSVDLSTYLEKTSQTQSFAQFNHQPIVTMESGMVTGEAAFDSASFEIMEGVFAAVSGSHEAEMLAEYYPTRQLMLVEDTLHMLDAVISGEAVAGVGNKIVIQYFVKNLISTRLKVISLEDKTHLDATYWRLAVKKDWPELTRIIDKALKDISEQRLVELQQKWLEFSASPTIDVLDLTAQERLYLNDKRVLRYCSHPDLMPVEGQRNKVSIGITGDYLDYFSQSLGLSVQLVAAQSWAEAQFKFKMGECDFLSLSASRKFRLGYAEYTKPYLSLPLAIVIHQKTPYAASLESLGGRSIGFTFGNPLGEQLRKRYPAINFVEVTSATEGLEKVRDSYLFGYVGALPILTYQLQHNFPNLLVGTQLSDTFLLGAAARRDQPLLASILNKAIDKMDVRLHTSIMSAWAPVSYRPVIDHRLVWAVLVVALIIVSAIGYSYYMLQKKYVKLKSLSTMDRLTGLYNRHTIDMVLAEQVSQYRFSKKPFSIILGDVDHFKLFNDRYGHILGDHVLKEVAFVFNCHASTLDLVGRWGGEEFIIICPGKTELQAMVLAELLRKKLAAMEHQDVGVVTCSFGVAEYQPTHSTIDVMQCADRSLYFSKRKGRNAVTSFTEYAEKETYSKENHDDEHRS